MIKLTPDEQREVDKIIDQITKKTPEEFAAHVAWQDSCEEKPRPKKVKP